MRLDAILVVVQYRIVQVNIADEEIRPIYHYGYKGLLRCEPTSY